MVYLKHFYHTIGADEKNRTITIDLPSGPLICAKAVSADEKVYELNSNIIAAGEK